MEIKKALLPQEKAAIRSFLADFGLSYQNADLTLYLENNEEIIGTVSICGHIIQNFAIRYDYQGENIASLLISELISNLLAKKIYYYQVYTKPMYKESFEAMSFREIITTKDICLLESKQRDINDVLIKLKKEYNIESNDVGAAVLNANPFTLGHRYLIEKSSKNHQLFLVFVLETDLSVFKYQDRIKLVRQGLKDLDNIIVLPSTDYLVSDLTFPTYFLKKNSDIVQAQAEADAMIFSRYFMPIFNIKKRYLGSETDLVTAKYNCAIQRILKDKVEIIERKEVNEKAISASLVRSLLQEKNFEEISKLVPPTTLEFLKNEFNS